MIFDSFQVLEIVTKEDDYYHLSTYTLIEYFDLKLAASNTASFLTAEEEAYVHVEFFCDADLIELYLDTGSYYVFDKDSPSSPEFFAEKL